jgi:hypothetical protein
VVEVRYHQVVIDYADPREIEAMGAARRWVGVRDTA